MEGKRYGLDQWLDTAVGGIRFAPDRRAVRTELAAHLEDKVLDLQRIFPDMTEAETQGRAMAQMGDLEELGRELAKIHRPWLGYLWRVSQVVLVAVVLWLGTLVWTGSADLGARLGFWRAESAFAGEEGGVGGFLARSIFDTEEVAPTPLPPQQPVRQGGYTFTVEEGTVWTAVAEVSDRLKVHYEGAVHLMLRVEWKHPGEPLVSDFDSWAWAEDNLRNRYLSWEEYHNGRETPQWGEPHIVHIGTRARTPLSVTYEVLVPVCSRETEWLELRYTHRGADLSIPLVLKGG